MAIIIKLTNGIRQPQQNFTKNGIWYVVPSETGMHIVTVGHTPTAADRISVVQYLYSTVKDCSNEAKNKWLRSTHVCPVHFTVFACIQTLPNYFNEARQTSERAPAACVSDNFNSVFVCKYLRGTYMLCTFQCSIS